MTKVRLFGITLIFCSEKSATLPTPCHSPIPKVVKAPLFLSSTFLHFFIENEIKEGKVLSHKIHRNTKFKGILIWLLHTLSSCLFTLCEV